MNKHIIKKLKLFSLILVLILLPFPVIAGDFDGSKTLLCSLFDATECTEEELCQRVTLESINAPQFVKIDFKKETISPVPERESKRTTAIENKEHIDGKLILQGAEDGFEGYEDGLGWSIAIKESNGKMLLTASGSEAGFVIFGACTVK